MDHFGAKQASLLFTANQTRGINLSNEPGTKETRTKSEERKLCDQQCGRAQRVWLIWVGHANIVMAWLRLSIIAGRVRKKQ